MTGRLKAWGANLILLFLAFALTAIGFEVVLHLFLPQKLYRFPSGLFRNDSELVFTLTPGFQGTLRNPEYTTEIRVNGLGLRGVPAGPKVLGAIRILGLGDSFVSAFNMAEADTFLSIAEQRLRKDFLERGVELVNAGTPNYGTWHELRLFQRLAPLLHPDLVLLCVYVGNDLENNLNPKQAIVRDGLLQERQRQEGLLPYPIRSWLQRNSMSYVFLWNAWNHLRPWFGRPSSDSLKSDKELVTRAGVPSVEKGYRVTAELLKEFQIDCNTLGIPMLMVLIPTEFQVYPDRFWRSLEKQGLKPSDFDLDLPQRRWSEIASVSKIPTVDLLPVFREHTSGPYLYMSIDGHLTREGNRLAGEAIADAVLPIFDRPWPLGDSMTRILLLVREKSAGWINGEMVPLMNEAECGTYAALTGIGELVEVMGLNHFLKKWDGAQPMAVVLVQPVGNDLRAVEARLQNGGGCLVSVGGEDGSRLRTMLPIGRTISGTSFPFSLKVSRLSGYVPKRSWRSRFEFPNHSELHPAPGEEILATWGRQGKPAIIRQRRGRVGRWKFGFPLDFLDPPGLTELLRVMDDKAWVPLGASAPHPAEVRGVVLLLHDVEEALPGDPRGIASVRNGLEACLEAQSENGVRATYNLVGTFAEKIPDLVCRIAAEGHELASHGGTHRVVAKLDSASLLEDVADAEKRIADICGVKVQGFRSPRTRWSTELLQLLETRGYRWNAEADSSSFPYKVPLDRPSTLVRIPVAADDWDYVKHRASPDRVSRLWRRAVRFAVSRGCWVAIGSHPSVLGADRDRLSAFRDFVRWLAQENVAVMTHGAAVKWWTERAVGKGSEAAGTGKRIERI